MLGLAVGDALGLPLENLSPRRGRKLFRHIDRHQFFFGKGVFSDDTEHACITAQALLTSGGDPALFRRRLARGLRWWVAGFPAGTGRATLQSCLKLWLGWSPETSGVFSAGNGPAMRSPLLGVCFGDDRPKLREFVRASTRITHSDPKAEVGALAVAWAAYRAAEGRSGPPPEPLQFLAELRELLGAEPAAAKLFERLDGLAAHLAAGKSTEEFARSLDLARGVSGYMFHTVPVAIYAWLRHPDDFR
ncbi:MAG: ADP-ribosylglycohydrolase family protein, partial [Gemmataceae bacterium]|nr:ADP-ribosylglycohydrolase family protein [Gemmataceae bacterium]